MTQSKDYFLFVSTRISKLQTKKRKNTKKEKEKEKGIVNNYLDGSLLSHPSWFMNFDTE